MLLYVVQLFLCAFKSNVVKTTKCFLVMLFGCKQIDAKLFMTSQNFEKVTQRYVIFALGPAILLATQSEVLEDMFFFARSLVGEKLFVVGVDLGLLVVKLIWQSFSDQIFQTNNFHMAFLRNYVFIRQNLQKTKKRQSMSGTENEHRRGNWISIVV